MTAYKLFCFKSQCFRMVVRSDLAQLKTALKAMTQHLNDIE
jgi:hypothetical protein